MWCDKGARQTDPLGHTEYHEGGQDRSPDENTVQMAYTAFFFEHSLIWLHCVKQMLSSSEKLLWYTETYWPVVVGYLASVTQVMHRFIHHLLWPVFSSIRLVSQSWLNLKQVWVLAYPTYCVCDKFSIETGIEIKQQLQQCRHSGLRILIWYGNFLNWEIHKFGVSWANTWF